MAEQQLPVRHEVVFHLSESGKERADALLKRCGHKNLQLLIARGLALVEWVEDQIEHGRTVGSVIYGEDGVIELRERPELRKPIQRQRDEPIGQEAVEPRRSVESLKNDPRLMIRRPDPSKTQSKPAPAPRTAFEFPAVKHSASGAVKNLEAEQEYCQANDLEPPISFAGKPLPAMLCLDHLPTILELTRQLPETTHFAMDDMANLCPTRYEPGKGWLYLTGSRSWAHIEAPESELHLYPIGLAIEYLRRQEKSHDAEEAAA